jgi:hypothetical protein
MELGFGGRFNPVGIESVCSLRQRFRKSQKLNGSNQLACLLLKNGNYPAAAGTDKTKTSPINNSQDGCRMTHMTFLNTFGFFMIIFQ